MNIKLSKLEYRLLLDILAIADWVMHANALEEHEYFHEHKCLKNKLLALHQLMDAGDRIKPAADGNTSACYENAEYEEYIQKMFIRPYEEHFFWDELIHRLGERDVANSLGFDQSLNLESELLGRFEKLEEIRQQYVNEFQEFGLSNLQIKHILHN